MEVAEVLAKLRKKGSYTLPSVRASYAEIRSAHQTALVIVNTHKKTAQELGFKGIGVAKTYVHLDTRSGRAKMWVY
jgi:hypothetical protein